MSGGCRPIETLFAGFYRATLVTYDAGAVLNNNQVFRKMTFLGSSPNAGQKKVMVYTHSNL